MKVEKGTGFRPITITLETENEAKFMWMALNVSITGILSQSNRLVPGAESIAKMNYDMHEAYNKVYRPIPGW